MTASRRALLAAFPFIGATAALAQERFPNRPVRIVVPYAPGGTTDIVARMIAERISGPLGQSVLVENRPGGGAVIGSEMVARAAPDGHTLLMATNGSHGINPAIFRRLSYDPVRDFAPISMLAAVPLVLVVPSAVPVNNIAELVAYLKSRSDTQSYGSAGIGSSGHLAGEMYKRLAGVTPEHIPYRGDAALMPDLIAGRLVFAFANLPGAIGFVRVGNLRALAVTGDTRSTALPDVSTMREAGLPDFQVDPWYGLLAPAGTPLAVVTRLYELSVAALREPAAVDQLRSLGAQVIGKSPAEFAAALASDIARYTATARAGNISVDP
jgi:tripartite-type tricarboxylate transporter receptor subunit TctC